MNTHLDDYLNYYLELPVAPRYAVMLQGAWGSGKSFYIDSLRNKLEINNRKVVYISLYGVRDTTAIDNAVFGQLHPFLSSKSAQLAGKLLTGVLKATIKIDLDKDGKDDAAISAQIPSINLPDYLSNTDQHIFVFDDLERCELTAVSALGYINYFVEHLGLKVIIAANEAAIPDVEKDAYFRKKEKVVGCTLEVQPNFSSALKTFLGEITSSKDTLTTNKDMLEINFSSSNHGNLRVVRQTILGYERLHNELSETAKNNSTYVSDLLSVYVPLSLEYLSGNLTADEISVFLDGYGFLKTFGNEDRSSKPEVLRQKYSSMSRNVINPQWNQFWTILFQTGQIQRRELQELTACHPIFLKNTDPNWKKIFWWSQMTQKELDLTLDSVLADLKQRKYKDIYLVLSVFGTLLELATDNLTKRKSVKTILKMAEQYIRTLSKEKLLLDLGPGIVARHIDVRGGYMGLGYPQNNEYFNALLRQTNEIVEKQAAIKQRDISHTLLALMKEDYQEFSILISTANGIHWSYPVFSHIKAKQFLHILMRYESCAPWFLVAQGLHDRYQYSNVDAYFKLIDELPFFEELNEILSVSIKSQKGVIRSGMKYLKTHAIEFSIEQLRASKAALTKSSTPLLADTSGVPQ